MKTTFPAIKGPIQFIAPLMLVGCVGGATVDTSSQAITSAQPPVTPAMGWLAQLPAEKNGEHALAKFFANGTATYVPTGDGTGYPVLFHSVPELNWLASQLWGGKTFRVSDPGATYPNGDPVVRLDNKIIKTPEGGLLNLFDAFVTRSTIADLKVGVNSRGETVPLPSGTLAPVPVSFLKEGVAIDDKPSVWLNYFDDKTLPVIRRILDEIREIDGTNCKGLFLGRALARRCTSFDCGELPSVLVDFPSHPEFDTKYEWGFWTYFILNFGQPNNGTCDLGPAIETVKQQFTAEGLDSTLPAAPAVK
jgi:hypothetical protein